MRKLVDEFGESAKFDAGTSSFVSVFKTVIFNTNKMKRFFFVQHHQLIHIALQQEALAAPSTNTSHCFTTVTTNGWFNIIITSSEYSSTKSGWSSRTKIQGIYYHSNACVYYLFPNGHFNGNSSIHWT